MKDRFVPASKSAAQRISDMIFVEKKYFPGEKLPNEYELSAGREPRHTA